MTISHTVFKWLYTVAKNKTPIEQKVFPIKTTHQNRLANIHAARVVDRIPLNDALIATGWSLDSIFADDAFSQTDLVTKQCVLDVMITHSEFKYCRSTKEMIYQFFASCDWLRGTSRIELIELLFKHFEIKEMKFNKSFYEDSSENQTVPPYSKTDETRWKIGLAISCLINPKLVSHKKYREKLSSLLHNKSYNKGRSELVIPYARIAKEEAVPDLISFLEERDLLHNSIFELGKLRAVEAKPHLEKIVAVQEPFFKNLAKAALKKIPE